jgi:predicted transcriptional regulator of viral defense system
MDTLAQQVRDAGYADRVLSDRQLARLLGGSDQRRYGLVNRALNAETLVRLKRGIYVLADQFRTNPAHPFYIAQALAPGSYISMETALAFHSWIPEAVYATVSITPKRKSKEIDNDKFGRFSFYPLAVHPSAFLESVERIQMNNQPVFVASPARALLDLVAYKKIAWQGLEWIESGLRVDREHLLSIRKKDFAALKRVYKHKAVLNFLAQLESALTEERRHNKSANTKRVTA